MAAIELQWFMPSEEEFQGRYVLQEHGLPDSRDPFPGTISEQLESWTIIDSAIGTAPLAVSVHCIDYGSAGGARALLDTLLDAAISDPSFDFEEAAIPALGHYSRAATGSFTSGEPQEAQTYAGTWIYVQYANVVCMYWTVDTVDLWLNESVAWIEQILSRVETLAPIDPNQLPGSDPSEATLPFSLDYSTEHLFAMLPVTDDYLERFTLLEEKELEEKDAAILWKRPVEQLREWCFKAGALRWFHSFGSDIFDTASGEAIGAIVFEFGSAQSARDAADAYLAETVAHSDGYQPVPVAQISDYAVAAHRAADGDVAGQYQSMLLVVDGHFMYLYIASSPRLDLLPEIIAAAQAVDAR